MLMAGVGMGHALSFQDGDGIARLSYHYLPALTEPIA